MLYLGLSVLSSLDSIDVIVDFITCELFTDWGVAKNEQVSVWNIDVDLDPRLV